MRRTLSGVAFFLLCSGVFAAWIVLAPSPKETKVALLLTRMQGVWKRESGKAVGSDAARKPRIIPTYLMLRIDGKRWWETSEVNGMEGESQGFDAVIDPEGDTVSIDLIFNSRRADHDELEKFSRVGIVKVEGNFLTVCFRQGAKSVRPLGFTHDSNDSANAGVSLWTFERLK